MPWKTPQEEAVYALDYNLDRSELTMSGQLAYDQIKAVRQRDPSYRPAGEFPPESRATNTSVDPREIGGAIPAHTPQTPRRWPQTPEDRMEMYARQTRDAVRVIAWIVGFVFVLSVIGAIIVGVQLGKVSSELNTGTASSNCLSQGGTDPSC